MEPDLKEPVLIVGLPGIAYVAKLTVDYLVKELKADLFEELYHPSFPPYVLIGEDGVVELLRNEFYLWGKATSTKELILFTGNVQASSPEGQYEVAEAVLDRAERLKVGKLFTLSAYISEKPIEKPRVFATATTPGLVNDMVGLGATVMEGGNIKGTNGLVLGLAKVRGTPGICLLGETPAYTAPSGHIITDPKAAKAVLEVLTKALDITVDMSVIERSAKQAEQLIRKIQEMFEEGERRAAEEALKASTSERRLSYIG
jgi:uncharacterized protein (TIGR00162 family)